MFQRWGSVEQFIVWLGFSAMPQLERFDEAVEGIVELFRHFNFPANSSIVALYEVEVPAVAAVLVLFAATAGATSIARYFSSAHVFVCPADFSEY